MTATAGIEELATLFLPTVRLIVADADRRDDEPCVVVEALGAGERETPGLLSGDFALLVVPEQRQRRSVSAPCPALIAAESSDGQMPARVAQLLNPARVSIDLAHITWLPGLLTDRGRPDRLDNPQASDLLMYEGAKDVLIDMAEGLRDAGFHVDTRLRENKDAAAALLALADELSPALVVLGRGKHGVGIGRDLLCERGLPALYLPARG